jgi:PAS domain S-box-containing protein
MLNNKILIVEDEFIEAMGFEKSLKSFNYNVVGISSSGEDALKKIDQLKPDLVLLDIILNGELDGIETAAKIKEDYNIPVVYLTAHPEESVIRRAKFTSPYGYIIKPVNNTDLKNTIELAIYKHQMENKLKKSEKFYRKLFYNMLEGFAHCKMLYDEQGDPEDWIYLNVNNSFERITGLKNIIGKKVTEAIPNVKELEPELFEIYGRVASTGESETFETFIEPLGIWLNISVFSSVKDHFVAVFENVTERKDSENRIKKLYRLYATLSQINQSVVRIKDEKELFKTICKVCVKFGEFKMAWIGLIDPETGNIRPVAHYGHEDGYLKKISINVNDKPSMNHPTTLALNKGEVIINENIKKNLHREWYNEALKRGYQSLVVIPIKLKEKVIGNLNIYASEPDFFNEDEINLAEEIVTDISYAIHSIENEKQYKIANDALSGSEKNYRELVDNSLVAIYKTNLKGEILFANNAMLRIFNFKSIEELKSKNVNRLYANSADREKFIAKLKNEGSIRQYELEMKSNTGERINIIISAILEYGYISGMIMDITKRKKAEQALLMSEERFRAVAESAVDAIVTTDINGKILFCNDSLENIFGYSQEEIFDKNLTVLMPERFKKDYLNELKRFKNSGEHLRLGKTFRTRGLKKDGTEFPFEMSLAAWKTGEESFFTSIIRDFTKRQKLEDSLRDGENKYRSIFENTGTVTIVIDEDMSVIDANSEVEKLTGFKREEIVGKKKWSEFVNQDEYEKLRKYSIKRNDDPNSVPKQYETRGKDRYGNVKDVLVTVSNIPVTGKKLLSIIDITARKKAEESLRLSNLYNRSLIEASLDPLITIGPDGKVTDVNNSTVIVTGYSRDELIGTDFSDYFTEPEKARDGYQEVFREGFVRDYPLEIHHKDGHITPVLYNASVYHDESGNVVGVFAAARDITEVKKANETIIRAKEEWERTFDAVPDLIAIINNDYRFLRVNKRMAEKLGVEPDDCIGLTCYEAVHCSDEPHILCPHRRLLEDGLEHQEEVHEDRLGGDFIVSVSPLHDNKGNLMGAVHVARDISKLKNVENELRKFINQKDILIKEIHHRVKNNLQIISSLLYLQEDYVKNNPTAVNVLQESQHRVISMAMLHEMLYQTNDLSQINFSDYIENLVSNLINSYSITNKIRPVINVDHVFLNMETAVPCGLIICELVSNSLKYAYPHEGGELNISFKTIKNELELVISDYGVGFPEELDFRNIESSLGLRLVNSLVSQLDGIIELDRSSGTKFTLKFKELKYKERI